MTEISAKIIEDSVGHHGKRLTTMVLRYPRFIHAELMTHRMLSRNASSSRAVPVKKIIQQIIDDPVIPLKWIKEQKGMQGYDVLEPEFVEHAEGYWKDALDQCVRSAERLVALGVHKSLANRLLEPFSHITVLVSATEWANFFTLRWHKAAENHFQLLAEEMAKVYRESTPKVLGPGEWHLPFVLESERQLRNEGTLTLAELLEFSTARAARVSYINHDGSTPNWEKDSKLHNDLVVAEPLHASPAEHQGQCHGHPEFQSGNFFGWIQYRKTLANENATTFPWDKK